MTKTTSLKCPICGKELKQVGFAYECASCAKMFKWKTILVEVKEKP